jgi:hypothetical protein
MSKTTQPREILDRAIVELADALQPLPPGTAESPIVVELHKQLFALWDSLTEALQGAKGDES